MYRIMEYKPLLDSSNMMMTDWGKIASDLYVSHEFGIIIYMAEIMLKLG